jgi:peptide-methionine (R)-S-oxide reductase
MSYNYLIPEQESVIVHKATEAPFTGEYDNFFDEGAYICRKCNAPLFRSKNKFNSGCGWPSFDGSFLKTLKRVPDSDGIRIEIECANCGGHLGHEFLGEHLTDKNIRECVNSLSIRFIPDGKELSRTINEQQ